DRFVARVVDVLEGVVPKTSASDPENWPGGRVLTPRDQRLAEATVVARYPFMLNSRTFRNALQGVRMAPWGAERARLLEAILDDYRAGEIGQSQDVALGVDLEAAREIRRKEVKEEWGAAQWSDRGRSRGS